MTLSAPEITANDNVFYLETEPKQQDIKVSQFLLSAAATCLCLYGVFKYCTRTAEEEVQPPAEQIDAETSSKKSIRKRHKNRS
ncbi:MAG: hypothetical protein SFW66_00930 [Gammaproteobacteria bacterium]|nr:hypothetical protein [Gammaproteobacteria bacterium]